MTPLSSRALLKILAGMASAPANVRYRDLAMVCEHFFGSPRHRGTSHWVFRTPWAGDPRVNIQDDHGKAKAYQVRQVLKAIARLEDGT